MPYETPSTFTWHAASCRISVLGARCAATSSVVSFFLPLRMAMIEREPKTDHPAKGAEIINTIPPSQPFPEIDLNTLLSHLTQLRAYPSTLPAGEPISVVQTHASAVLLAGDRVYKLKKAKDFGFFDYSTPALRRHFCEQEVLLNARLAPPIYLGVAPVLASPNGTLRFGEPFAPGSIPEPGTLLDQGRVIDYAVVMVRLPDEATLASRIAAGTVTPALVAHVARPVVNFHASAATNPYIASFGSLKIIGGNWEENFAQMKPYIDRTLDAATYEHLSTYVHDFLVGYEPLFAARVRDGRIRDSHGDLRLQHVYLLDDSSSGGLPASDSICIVDCIEFNERFRYSDVAAEIAFLTMEMEETSRADLARAFVDAYVVASGDEALRELLPFYACYRACVRGKVLSFQLDEPEVSAAQRELVRQQAEALFAQAALYARGPTRPTVAIIGGLMGTGKSTLAQALHRELGWVVVSSDAVRKRLAHLDPARPEPEAYGHGIYSGEWSARTYQAMLEEASAALATGRSVILDASFARRADRDAAAHEASLRGAHLVFIECRCPREVTLAHLAQRWSSRITGIAQTGKSLPDASDGRPELYDAQAASWQPFDIQEESVSAHMVIDTVVPVRVSLAQVLDHLSIPHFICRV